MSMKSYGRIKAVEYTRCGTVIVNYELASVVFPNPFATIGRIAWVAK